MSMEINEILLAADKILNEKQTENVSFPIPKVTQLAGWIDHTILKPEATKSQIKKLCEEAIQYHFATVCVNPVNIPFCVEILKNSDVGICSVVGFPLGSTFPEIKAEETRKVINFGATEIDTVINVGAMKSGQFDLVFRDIQEVCNAAKGKAIVKVILEMCYLDQREKIIGCLLCKEAGVDFVKTSTGFGSGGAAAEDVALMRSIVGEQIGVKAAGGIRTLADAMKMIEAGASRIGASAGISFLREGGLV